MIKVYFDNTLINPDYYANLEKSTSVFNGKFKLGSTICESYKFSVDKSQIVNKEPSVVYLYNDNTLLKTLFVDNYSEKDFTIDYELVDSMVNFNFGYDASQIFVDEKTTLLDIFEDIVQKAGLLTDINSFDFSNMEVSWFDNTISARDYLGYIAEINGSYVYITPDNKVAFKEANSNSVDTITFDEVSDYKIGLKHHIDRVVWDDGINKWENGTGNYDTYYINTSNVFVISQEVVNNIGSYINDFEFYDFETTNIPSNSYSAGDIITFTDGTNNYKTIVQYDNIKLSGTNWFGGVKLNIETTKQEETEIIGTEKRIKSIKNIVDRDSNTLTTLITDTSDIKTDLRENYYTLQQTNQLVQNSATGLTNTFSEAGGNNIFRNTGLWFSTSDQNNPYEFWNGVVVKTRKEEAHNMNALLLQNTTLYQEQEVPNGNYTISFKSNKLIELANVQVFINDIEYELEENFKQTIQVSSKHIRVSFVSDIANSCEIYDLMVNAGEVALAYSQNQNETTTDSVNISKGITITSSDLDVTFKANADGIRTLDKNNNEITKFTDTGMTTKKATIEDTSTIVGLLFQEVGSQTWITRL